MSEISATMVNELRAKTGAGLMDCKRALVESKGDQNTAAELLRKKGIASAVKKADRAASEGIITSYIHMGGKVGVLIEVNCETDFVAKTDEFQGLAKDLCMQIAAASPLFVGREQRPPTCWRRKRKLPRPRSSASRRRRLKKSSRARLTSGTAPCACSSSRSCATRARR